MRHFSKCTPHIVLYLLCDFQLYNMLLPLLLMHSEEGRRQVR